MKYGGGIGYVGKKLGNLILKWKNRCLSQMIDKETINHEYLPVLGLDSFSTAATAMLLGESYSTRRLLTMNTACPETGLLLYSFYSHSAG
jgi:hypothetical protein